MEPSIEELLQQALRDGNTPAAASLARTMEERTRLATIHYSQMTGNVAPQQQTYSPVQTRVASRPVKKKLTVTNFIFSWQLAVIMVYIAIAEVLAPGHNGLTGIPEMHWFWGPRAIAGLVNVKLPTPEAKMPQEEAKPVEEAVEEVEEPEEAFPEGDTLRAPSVVMTSCGKDSNGGEFSRFDIGGAVFQVNNVLKCHRGIRKEGDAIAVLSNASLMSVSRDGKIENYTRENLKDWGLLK